ncbi:MAG: hypothetical protein JSS89_12135 [Bacteroidetes bacterium]|nr:hypothetical protein [Bacteroidota bacterium]
MEYFAQVKTVQGATKRYYALAKKWHPDRNGSVEAGAVMAEINRQYREALVLLNNAKRMRDQIKQESDSSVHDAEAGPTGSPPTSSSNASAVEYARRTFAIAVGERELQEIESIAQRVATNVAITAVSYGMGKLKAWITQK